MGSFTNPVLLSKDEIRKASLCEATRMVRHNLESSNDWLVRGLLALLKRQTAAERQAGQTHDRNGVGFNGSDAEFLTSTAKQFLDRNWLSDKQLNRIRRMMLKYAGQLARIARENEPKVRVLGVSLADLALMA